MSDNIKLPVQSINPYTSIPKYAYKGDAGFDLISTINCTIAPGQRHIINCGFCLEIPNGYAGLVIPRSGLAAKHGITVLNTPGLIDSGYRGEICVILYNTDLQTSFSIEVGDRIAQMMIVPFVKCEFTEVESMQESQRQNKGFGSSGIN